jgi:hypothetical protein
MKTGEDDYLRDIEQYYGFDFKSTIDRYKYQATWKKLIIWIALLMTIVTMRIILVTLPTLVRYISLKPGTRS